MAKWKKPPQSADPAPEPAPEPEVYTEPEPQPEVTSQPIELPAFLDSITQFNLMQEINALVGFDVPPMALLGGIFVLATLLLLYGMWEREPNRRDIEKYRPDRGDQSR